MMNKNTQQWFEKMATEGTWPSRYASKNSINYNFITRRDAVKQILENDTFLSVLDLGCGTGDYVEILSDFVTKYVGVDFAPTMIRQAKHKYSKSNINPFFLIGCAEILPFVDDSFDLIIAIGFIEYFEDPSVALQEIVRVLKPRGTIIMQSFKIDFYKKMSRVFCLALKNQPGSHLRAPHLDMLYSKDELDELMKNSGFRKTSYLYNNFNIFPRFIQKRFPGAYIGLSEKISHWKPNTFGIFAVNYVGRYILDSN